MLKDLRKDMEQCAKRIGDWEHMSKLEIAQKYIENEGTPLGESYYAAFCLRYWHEIPNLYKEVKILVDNFKLCLEDIADWYFEAIDKVFKYRAFMNKEVFKYQKDGNPDKFINGYVYKAIDTIRDGYFQYYNFQKRRIGFQLESLDKLMEDYGGDFTKSPDERDYSAIDKIIKSFVESNELFTALILYIIAYEDCFSTSENEETGGVSHKYSHLKTLHIIRNMDFRLINRFCNKYATEDIRDDILLYSYYTPSLLKVMYRNALNKLKNCQEVIDLCY